MSDRDRPPFDQDDDHVDEAHIDDHVDDDVDDEYVDDEYVDDGYVDDDYVEPGDDEYVEVRRRSSSGCRRLAIAGVAVLLVLVLAAGAGAVWVQRQIDPPGEPGDTEQLVIPEGSTSDDIGALLASEDIISSELVWEWYLRINGGGPFQAGTYELAKRMAIGDVIDVLGDGPAAPEERTFTIPEALTLKEILDRLADPDKGLGLDRDALQQLMDSGQIRWSGQPADQPSNEGILFPETYRVPADVDEKAVLQKMVGQLESVTTELDVASAQQRFNLTPYEVLTVASLIEEETKVDSERSQVARVIYNRLSQGIPLGIDATSRYEAVLAGRDRSDVDFDSTSPYNTRKNAGLPPTPIASPGRASIEAALNPAEGPWIYYVLEDAEGHHFFTDSNSEFIAAKARCRENGLGCG
ncbi:MAG: endolytic transglycosylase MltG [Acidimicrobiales bacterium]